MRTTMRSRGMRAGFTMVEVALTVVLLAVLTKFAVASLSDPSYQAYDDAMTADMHQLVLREEVFYNTNSDWALGTADNAGPSALVGSSSGVTLSFLASPGVHLAVAANGLGYSVTATHEKYPTRTCRLAVVPGVAASAACS